MTGVLAAPTLGQPGHPAEADDPDDPRDDATATASASATATATATAVLRALADPQRLRLLELVRDAGGEACVCDLTAATDRSQPTVSHHLRVLVEAGVLEREKRGVWAWYRVRPEPLRQLQRLVGELAAPTTAPRPGGCS